MAGVVAGWHWGREVARLGGPWRQAVEEERGAMESAGAGVWPGLVAEPRWLA